MLHFNLIEKSISNTFLSRTIPSNGLNSILCVESSNTPTTSALYFLLVIID